jgi:phosphonate transport system substrate-binding protein
MTAVLFASLAADNAAPFYRALVQYLSSALGTPVRLLDQAPWQEREHALRHGRAQLGVVCGLQYVRAEHALALLAAPVMRGRRYGGRPLYFSDVVVRRDLLANSFDALKGARFAVNEPTSHSGYGIVRYALAERRYDGSFFSAVIESGAHERSLELVLNGQADAAAIDSTVLETELRRRPRLAEKLRVVATFGPSPSPPLVASGLAGATLRAAVVDALQCMPLDPFGIKVLMNARVARFAPVADADYEPIREMARLRERVRLACASTRRGRAGAGWPPAGTGS